MRIALVGLGEVGSGAHLPALLRHPDIDLVALVDPDADRRDMAAALTGPVKTAANMTVVLDDVAAVVLATPPWVTPDLTVTAVRAGRFVLAEKPVATSTAAAAVYAGLTEGERRRVQVGLTYRHDPAMEELRAQLAALGPRLLVRAHVYDERRDPGNPAHLDRIRETLRHGMPVVHEGAHVFDWLSMLLGGGPQEIDDAWSLRTDPDHPSPNLVGARLTYPGGHVALVEFGWLTDALPRCEISVLGARGHALLDGFTFHLDITTAAGHTVHEPAGDRTTRCFDRQVQRFADLVAGRSTTPEPSLVDGLAALTTAELVAKAAQS